MSSCTLEVANSFSKEVKRRRLELGMSRSQLAHAVNVHFTTVYDWEQGNTVPRFGVLPRLAKALNVTETELFHPSDTSEPIDKLSEKIVQEIKRLRLARKITQEEFAEKVGVTWSTVARWETGAVDPDVKYLPKFAEILGVSEEDLLNPSSDAEAPKKYARVEGRQGRKKKIMT